MRLALALALAAFLTPLSALAQEVRLVDRARIYLSDLVPEAPAEIASTDLGPSPPPGGSRLFNRSEIEGSVRKAGASPSGLRIPSTLRVVGAFRKLTVEQQAQELTPAIRKALPKGVQLVSLEPSAEVTLAPRAVVGNITIPRLPRLNGPQHSTATVEWTDESKVVLRQTVPINLLVDEQQAKPDVPKGSRLSLVVEQGAIRVTAPALVLADASLGQVISVSVTATGRVVKARLISPREARMVTQ